MRGKARAFSALKKDIGDIKLVILASALFLHNRDTR
jgi:hypothetical protein